MIALLILFLAGCSASPAPAATQVQETPPAVIAPAPSDAQTSLETPISSGQVKEFTIRAYQFGYEPQLIEVEQGDTVRISAYSSDVPHGLRIRDYNINLQLTGSTPVTAEFIADKPGTFSWSCSIPCGHSHRNMNGTLVVR